MLIFRRFIATILGLLAFFVLMSAAQAITFNIVFAKPTQVEKLLVESKLYDNFVSNLLQQAQQSSKDSGDGISISDPAVQQAAAQAFPPSQLQAYVNTFIDANYAWLQGKTDKPQFSIDLTQARQTFATNVGKAVEAHLLAIPVCTPAQTAALTTTDPLTVECRPASVSPAAERARIEQKLLDGSVLSTPVLTADTISPKGGKPYYESAKIAPTTYAALTYAPYALVAAFIVLSILIFFITPRRRSGLRAIGFIVIIGGLIMVSSKYAADVAFQKAQTKLFNDNSVGPLQHSLSNFLQLLEHTIASYYLYIGVFCIVVGVLCIVISIVKRSKKTNYKQRPEEKAQKQPVPEEPAPNPTQSHPTTPTPRVTAPLPAQSTTSATKPKRPRLIQ